MKYALRKIPHAALSLTLFFCCAVLSAQVLTLDQSVTTLSVNANDGILAVSDADSLSAYETPLYTRISSIKEENINRSLFYQEQNGELLIAMTDAGTFLLYRQADEGKAYGEAESYRLAGYADGKTLCCTAFSNNTNYIAAAYTDFSIRLHFKLRFTQDMITRTLTGHRSAIYSLAFSDDEKYLASVSTDGEAIIWDCATYTQAAKIEQVYTDSKIPAVFTADSLRLITMESESAVRISDNAGLNPFTIDTGNVVRALKPLPDADKIAVLSDKNDITIYSLATQKSVGVMRLPETEKTDITAFVFCHTETAAFVGCASGSVYKLTIPQDETGERHEAGLSEPPEDSQKQPEHTERRGENRPKPRNTGTDEPLTTEHTEADKPFKATLKAEKTRFLTVSALMGFLQPEKTNYRYLFGADVCYRSTYLTAPVYLGAGLRGYMALPKRPFPTQYEDFNGKTIAPPFLWMGEAYIPAGIEVVLDRRGYAVLFEELALTARLSALARPKVAASKPFFSFGGRFTTGITVKFFTFAVALNYDSLWKLFPEIVLGGRIDFKSNPKTEQEAL